MPILLDHFLDKITVRILKGPFWERDLATVKSIHNRKFNGQTKLWEVPFGQIGDFWLKWKESDLLWQNPVIGELYDSWKLSLTKLDELPPITKHVSFKRTPIDYQEKYIRTSERKTRLLCAFEQGTGKSFSSLERVRLLGFKRLLIVCPKVVCTNWRAEVRLVLEQESTIYQGTKAKRVKQMEAAVASKGTLICTYETLSEINDAIALGALPRFSHIIVDEAHLASNPDSKRFSIVNRLTNDLCSTSNVQCLTGTPMQHRVRDIWGLLYLLHPTFAGSREAFLLKYEQVTRIIRKTFPLMKNGQQVRDKDGKLVFWKKEIPTAWRAINLDLLRDYLSCIMYRVTRENVTDFKDTVEMITVELNSGQKKLYERLRDDLLVEIGDKKMVLKEQLVRAGRLLQAAEGLFNFEGAGKASSKRDYCDYLMQTAAEDCEINGGGEKILFWSRFEAMTRELKGLQPERGVIYSGKVSDREKVLAKWAFNGCDSDEDRHEYELLRKGLDWPFEPGEAQFLFGTIDMRSSLGMNLHKKCHKQVFTSFSWMPVANMQAADRLRRIGQDVPEVFTHFLVAEDTFEEQALTLILNNYATLLRALDGTSGEAYKQITQIIDLLRKEQSISR